MFKKFSTYDESIEVQTSDNTMTDTERIEELEKERERIIADAENRHKDALAYYAGADYLPPGSASQLAHHEAYGEVDARIREIDQQLSHLRRKQNDNAKLI